MVKTFWDMYGEQGFIGGAYTFYHITPKENVDSIKVLGLQIGREVAGQGYAGTTVPGIYLLEDEEFIQDYIEQFKSLGLGSEFAIVEVRLPFDWTGEQDETGISAIVTYSDIPIYWITSIKDEYGAKL